MNVRPGFLAALFLFLLLNTGAFAQGVVEFVVVKNESVSFEVQSRFEPTIGQAPSDGSIEIVEDPVFNYTITYTPDTDFVGDDQMLLVSFPFDQSIAFQNYLFKVREAFVKANHDFVSTTAGVSVTVAPLLNDSTNIGSLVLTGIPITNAGSAEIVGNEILFTPAAGFSGITDLNYTVCTDGNACTLGTVSINVNPSDGTLITDTVRVFTTQDKAQLIFAPDSAIPVGTPQSGDMITQDGLMAYQPHEGFVGDEFLAYNLPDANRNTVFHITVLDLKPNTFAVDDRAFTPTNTPATLNVLFNDLYSVFADCVVYGAPRFGTLTEDGPNGQITYIPPPNWTGVDQFTYSSKTFNCEGEAELATAYIFVSNFNPAATETVLTAPEGIPLDLTYEVSGGNLSWTVVSQPTYGTITTDPQTGKLNYLSTNGSAGSTDVFTLRYCLNEAEDGNCQFSTEVDVSVNITPADPNACADEDCVWPGDTNNDGVVDVGDLLPIGLAMGQTGAPRLEGSTRWSPQYSADWAQDLNGVNLKHVDADGDQIITAADTALVMANMGLGHGLRPQVQNFSEFQLSLVGPSVAEPGDLVALKLVAGANAVIVEDVYGIRWSFVYDRTVIETNSLGINFGEDSWMSYDSPILGVSNNDAERGVLESAMTRTNGLGISGFGEVATLSAVIVEDVYGIREDAGTSISDEANMTVTFGGGESASIMSSAGHIDAVEVIPFDLTIVPRPATEVIEFSPTAANDYLDGKLIAFPNPTSSALTVHLNGQQRFSALQLTDLTGRVLLSEQGLNTNHRELNLSQMPNGIYMLTITTDAGVVNRKVEVLR